MDGSSFSVISLCLFGNCSIHFRQKRTKKGGFSFEFCARLVESIKRGESRVVRSIPLKYTGYLYNIETTEHVFRVGYSGVLVHNSCPDLYFDSATRSWRSKGGLIYGYDRNFGNRVKHVFAHLKPDPSKARHSVFNVKRNELLPLIDEAWAKRGLPLRGDPGAYIINMGRTIGTAGEQNIKIIVKPGTNKIISAYPLL